MRRPLSLAIIAIAFGAGLAALALIPSELEHISMLERDGEIESATRLANTLYDRGDRRSAILARVFELNHTVGDASRADKALREYLAGTPDSPRTLRKAAEFFELEQDLEGTLSALANLVLIAPNTAYVEKLARLYRLHGRFGDEMALLERNRSLLGSDFLTRLGGLLAQTGNLAGAVQTLRVADDHYPADQEHYGSLLFDLLVSSSAIDEALRRASRWAALDTSIYPRLPMILRLIESGAIKEALALAGVPLSKPGSSPDAPRAGVIWALLSRGHVALAGDLVEQFSDVKVTRERREAITSYVSLAVARGLLGEIMAKTDRLLRASDERQKKLGLALSSALFEKWSFNGLGPLRAHLSPELAVLDPIFAAQVAFAEKQPAMASFYLEQADLTEDDESLSMLWLSLAEQSFAPTNLARELIRRRSEGELPSILLPHLQLAVRQAGLVMPGFDPFGAPSLAAAQGAPRSMGALP
ncbi:hypothetical protein IP69_14645 [Bosea sp. AAP35]|uniref:tetratricopeptide repeat protein n=1 Tax=Bosea sp. AAP35 TaxID=1523417 RepID=UPI0006B90C93|nr:hypothetical protein [Bosea sp. AAP35]KPF66549.1 hypothetical protein IP69_14645 [Bosea sp. AAP35]